MTRPRILVTGATGHTGAAVAQGPAAAKPAAPRPSIPAPVAVR